MELNKIYNESCIITMGKMGDKSIDLTMADFPYGIEEEYDSFQDSKDNLQKLVSAAMPEILRVSKIAFITCGVDNIHLYPKPTWTMAWVNTAGTGRHSWGFSCWQPILVYGKCPDVHLGCKPDIFSGNESSEINEHPCPKPIKFWSKLMHRGSIKEGDLIYDPFMGSGSTAIVAIKYKRNFIGSELSKRYVELAEKRIIPYKQQQHLF